MTNLIERLNRHADEQIDDNLDYIKVADDLMREAATALSEKDRRIVMLGKDRDSWKQTATEYAQEVHDLRARLASCEAEREKAIELIDEGLGILVSLIDNVTRHGNYSPESTCTFIDQAGWSFRAARAALTKGGEDAE